MNQPLSRNELGVDDVAKLYFGSLADEASPADWMLLALALHTKLVAPRSETRDTRLEEQCRALGWHGISDPIDFLVGEICLLRSNANRQKDAK